MFVFFLAGIQCKPRLHCFNCRKITGINFCLWMQHGGVAVLSLKVYLGVIFLRTKTSLINRREPTYDHCGEQPSSSSTHASCMELLQGPTKLLLRGHACSVQLAVHFLIQEAKYFLITFWSLVERFLFLIMRIRHNPPMLDLLQPRRPGLCIRSCSGQEGDWGEYHVPPKIYLISVMT
jgi:hypothetical protein